MVKREIIEMSASLGKAFRTRYPWIREDYLAGRSNRWIARKIAQFEKEGHRISTYARAVSYSLSGYDGSENVQKYEGTLSSEDRERLAKEHKKRDNIEEEVRKRISRKGILSRGRKPWLREEDLRDGRPGELESLLQLAKQEKFLHQEERIAGTLNYKSLARALHEIYPEVERNPKAVRMAIYRAKGNAMSKNLCKV